MGNDEKLMRRNVTLYRRDFQVVKAFGEAHGLDFSSALRFIIREWARARAQAEAEAPAAEENAVQEQEAAVVAEVQ